MSKKYIVAYCGPHSGLCNRLNCVISAIRGGEVMGREVLVYWPRGYNCDIPLKDLMKIDSIKEIDKKDFRRIRNKLKIHNFEFEKTPEEKFLILSTSKVRLPPEKNLNEREIVNKILEKFHPNEDILKRVNELDKRYHFNKLVGVHIRSGDWKYTSFSVVNISPEEEFEEGIQKILEENPTQKFLLCTGSKETESKFVNKFKDKIVIIPKHSQEFKDPNYKGGPLQIKEAMVDLLSLSRTKFLFGTWGSSFSEVAWRLSGGNKNQVRIIGAEKKEEIEKIKQLEATPRSLVSKVMSKISEELSARFALFRRLKFFFRFKKLERKVV